MISSSFFRRRCDCGARIEWVTGPAAVDVLGPNLMAQVMFRVPARWRRDVRREGEFWLCSDVTCGEAGVMVDGVL